ncbi:MAG: pyridoxal phosphate-dependent aminotransferase [Propionibacteriaceae bacterium]|nr:pyridoxal phosphate-dependent aminotransferase [Propionibacteriaceae bacterium]
MSEFLEVFWPGHRHWREERSRQHMTIHQVKQGGKGPLDVDLDKGVTIRRHPSGRVSTRARVDESQNQLSALRSQYIEDGIPFDDLTDSNPTRHGLMNPEIGEILAKQDALSYDPDPKGPLVAREALAERFGGEPDDYWLASSTSEAYSWLFTLLADPRGRIAIPAPGYPLLQPLAQLSSVRTDSYSSFYVPPGEWMLDAGALKEDAEERGYKSIVAVNPGNPTGAYIGSARDELLETCARTGAALISDEVFFPFAVEGGGERLANYEVPTFSLDGLSKLLCAPGLKCGWIRYSGPEEEKDEITPALDNIADSFLPLNAVVAAALPELLELADASVANVVRRLRANLKTLRETLPEAFRVRKVEGGWTALVDIPWEGEQELSLALLEQAHLYAHPGWFYDLSGSVLAISLLPEPASFARLMGQLRDFLNPGE